MQGDAVVRLDAGQREALGAFLKMQAQRSDVKSLEWSKLTATPW